MLVGVIALLGGAALGVLAVRAPSGMVPFASGEVSWLVPTVGLLLVPGAIGYTTGVAAARRLGARVAAFVSLIEVAFAVVVAWLWLGEAPTAIQAAGGALILAGVVLVRLEDSPRQRRAAARLEDRSGSPETTGLTVNDGK